MAVTTTNFFCLIFFRIPLKPGIYRFAGSASLLAFSVIMCNTNRGLIFYYWHNIFEIVGVKFVEIESLHQPMSI